MKKEGLLQLLGFLIFTALITYVAVWGIGKGAVGSYSDIKLGLDLAGGVSITYETVKENPTETEMNDTTYKMQKRADNESTESVVYREGTNRINVDIPNVTDAEGILERMGNAGSIYFIYGQGTDGIANIQSTDGSNWTLTRSMDEIIAAGQVVLDGSDVSNAYARVDTSDKLTGSKNVVILELNDSGSGDFATATEYAAQYYYSSQIKSAIAIVYDNEVISAPVVQEKITGGTAMISVKGEFSEATTLASTIRIGALPLELTEVRSNIVGAKLGAEAINTSLIAGLIGFILVIIFMIAFYRIPGLAASLALSIYVGLMVIILNIFNVTLTLSGVAGILLSVGMAVDANVIIFTRIKEELATGKTVRSSTKIGFKKARTAIIDGNVTTLIAAVVLMLMSSGTVKGFAYTLAIGVALSMFTALIITYFILQMLYNLGLKNVKLYGVKKERNAINFVKPAPRRALLAIFLILFGIGSLVYNKINTGSILNFNLDFMGGTSTEITFNNSIDTSIQGELENLIYDTIGKKAEISIVEGSNSVIIKTSNLELEEREAVSNAVVEKYGVDKDLIETNNISASISSEMRQDAIIAVIIATICMLIYIWIRFKNISYAFSAVIALIHDILIVLMVYAVARNYIEVGSTFIACMLTIVGYSINSTIVIFDRIREKMKEKLNKESTTDIVNASITDTFSRSINTSITTLFMVVPLVIFGVVSVREFSIPLMAGIIAGAFSSICLTGPLWLFLQSKLSSKKND